MNNFGGPITRAQKGSIVQSEALPRITCLALDAHPTERCRCSGLGMYVRYLAMCFSG